MCFSGVVGGRSWPSGGCEFGACRSGLKVSSVDCGVVGWSWNKGGVFDLIWMWGSDGGGASEVPMYQS